MKLRMVNEPGPSREGTLKATLCEIVAKLGQPNVLNDQDNVDASWGFEDEDTGRRAYIWCYKCRAAICESWSTGGDQSLIEELFSQKTAHG